ncbi:unnamed protein product [Rotaria socialis]|uniref:V-SNARE coiled-coil homology domain-containing protein n=1 Tax=Rotaria socialis TaxID=392032 RepID=A0A820MB45_9BILA|nr:unnamed protein product [Rotaria socialis]CAF4484219.1 unnamed protein product [Rotaria socialis]CAF4633111.1 unnamed protein product [Rotaria socialis]CAF4995379.1 unnamed protein product [Rotaria socialis]
MTNPSYQGDGVRYTPSSVQKLQGEVTGIMKDNIRLELDRAGKLDDLEQKSDMLNEGSRQFAIHAQKLKKKYWWKNCRMWVILIGIIVIIIVIIVVAVVIKSKKK